MKYDKELYVDSGFYGDFGEEEVSCYKEKVVKCRKPHKCSACEKEINVGDHALSETGFMDGQGVSCYTCIPCIEEWLEESGQVDTKCDDCEWYLECDHAGTVCGEYNDMPTEDM